MRSTKRSKRSPLNSSSESSETQQLRVDLEKIVTKVLRAEIPRIASKVASLMIAEGWSRRTPPPPSTPDDEPKAAEIFEAARNRGSDGVREILVSLPLEALKRVVGNLGFDPERKIRRWKEQDRILSFIADEAVKRVKRNRVFLEDVDHPRESTRGKMDTAEIVDSRPEHLGPDRRKDEALVSLLRSEVRRVRELAQQINIEAPRMGGETLLSKRYDAGLLRDVLPQIAAIAMGDDTLMTHIQKIREQGDEADKANEIAIHRLNSSDWKHSSEAARVQRHAKEIIFAADRVLSSIDKVTERGIQ